METWGLVAFAVVFLLWDKIRRLERILRENDIILMHDQYKSTVTAALKIVDELTEQGYEFVTVDELLLD